MVNKSISITPKATTAYLKSFSPRKEKTATATLINGVSIISKIPRLMMAVASPLRRLEKISEKEETKPLYYKGKKLHAYTFPVDSKGGIFSKTHIKIDENNILNLRIQMIPPKELWERKE